MERAQAIQAELASLRARIAHTSRAVVVALQSLPEPGARRLVVDAVLEQAEAVMAMASELNRLTRELHELNADAGLGVDMVAVIRANDVCGASIQELFSVLPSDDDDDGGGGAADGTEADGSDDELVEEVDKLLAGDSVLAAKRAQYIDRFRRLWRSGPVAAPPARTASSRTLAASEVTDAATAAVSPPTAPAAVPPATASTTRATLATTARLAAIPVVGGLVGAAVLGPVGAFLGFKSGAWLLGLAAVGASAGAGTGAAVQAISKARRRSRGTAEGEGAREGAGEGAQEGAREGEDEGDDEEGGERSDRESAT